MFYRWYPLFKHVTIKSRIIELPVQVVEYLLSDGVVLPSGVEETPSSRRYSEDDSDDDVEWDSTDGASAPSFPELEALVAHNIDKLGGAVFPKLDWSSPKDAIWVTFGHTLCCRNICDILLLLKSSDFVTHDLTDPFGGCVDSLESHMPVTHHLVLREWQDVLQDCEFRCFVKNNGIIAISQRHLGVFYPSITESKKRICDDILNFFNTHIKNKFFDEDYTFDVWCQAPDVITLIDFNPFGTVTDGLLFTWEELAMSNYKCMPVTLDFRCVESKDGIQPDPYRFYAMPQDFVHLTSGIDPAKFCDLLHLKIQTANDADSDSD
jgi:hypothetical protein